MDIPKAFSDVFPSGNYQGFESAVFPHVTAWGRFIFPMQADERQTARLRTFDKVWKPVRRHLEALMGFRIQITIEQTGVTWDELYERLKKFAISLELTDHETCGYLLHFLANLEVHHRSYNRPKVVDVCAIGKFMSCVAAKELAQRFTTEVFGSPEKMATVLLAIMRHDSPSLAHSILHRQNALSWKWFKSQCVGGTSYAPKPLVPSLDQTMHSVAKWLMAVGRSSIAEKLPNVAPMECFSPEQQAALEQVCRDFCNAARSVVYDEDGCMPPLPEYLTDETSVDLDKMESGIPLDIIGKRHILFRLGVEALEAVYGPAQAKRIVNRLRGVYAEGLQHQFAAVQKDWRHQFYQAPNAKIRKELAQDPLRPENIAPLDAPTVKETNFLSLLFAPLTSVLMAFVEG